MAKGSNMEVTVKISPSVFIKAEGSNMEEIIQAAAPIQEVAAVYNKGCQKCKRENKPNRDGNNIRFHSRTADKFTFSELICMDCGARLAFGKDNDDHLFARWYEQDPDDPKKPLLKDGKKVPLPDGGWLRYDRTTGKSS